MDDRAPSEPFAISPETSRIFTLVACGTLVTTGTLCAVTTPYFRVMLMEIGYNSWSTFVFSVPTYLWIVGTAVGTIALVVKNLVFPLRSRFLLDITVIVAAWTSLLLINLALFIAAKEILTPVPDGVQL